AHRLLLRQQVVACEARFDFDDLAHLAELFDAFQQNDINHRYGLPEGRDAAANRARLRTARAAWRPVAASRTCRPAYRKRRRRCRDAAAAARRRAAPRARRGRTAPTAR